MRKTTSSKSKSKSNAKDNKEKKPASKPKPVKTGLTIQSSKDTKSANPRLDASKVKKEACKKMMTMCSSAKSQEAKTVCKDMLKGCKK